MPTAAQLLQRAVQEGLIRTNPAVGCKLPPKKAREMQVLTQNEIIRFSASSKGEGYYELFLLELGTGMRRGEILALKWSDLNFKTGELHIERQVYIIKAEVIISEPKTKASIRTVILPPSLLKTLVAYKETVIRNGCFRHRLITADREIRHRLENGYN